MGTLNDFVFSASVFLDAGDSVLESNLKLAGMPSKVIGFNLPSEAAQKALALQSAR